jgi:6-phosphogluconate dehydrogenase
MSVSLSIEKSVQQLVCESAVGASDFREMLEKLATPRAIWLMVPAAAVDQTVADLMPRLAPGDTIIDGGNSYYVDDTSALSRIDPPLLSKNDPQRL